MFNKLIKLFVILGLFYQTPVYSKSASFNEFNSRDLSNYFSGIIAFENKNNSDALKFFNASRILLKKHDAYLGRYIYSLVLENKVAQAISVVKNGNNEKNTDFFDAYMLLIVDGLKRNNLARAEKYLNLSFKFQSQNRLNSVILESLREYLYTFRIKQTLPDKKNFGNISIINQALQRCYLKKDSARSSFLNLINNPNGDYSRYIFFYINYLIENNQIDEAKIVSKQLKYINSTLLLTQSKSWVENKKFNEFSKIFSCNNHNHIIGEFLFLMSNLYSSQGEIKKSNFYLNLSEYLNPKFIFNSTLLAENFYLNEEYEKVKKVLKKFDKKYEFYYWFKVKKKAQIIIKNQGYKEGIKFISSKFSKINKPNVKMVFDIANFHKNSKDYKKAIEYYTKVILLLEDSTEIKSDILYRRGGSYERLGEYKKADEDLINSLKINPDDPYVLNYLAYSWLERDFQIEEAMKMLKKAYSLKSDDPYITDSIGWAYFLIENYVDAEQYIKKAVELMPEDPIVNDHYGDILWKLKRNIQARYFWNYVLSLDETSEDVREKINIKIINGLDNS